MQRIFHASYLQEYSSSASSTSFLSPTKMEQYHYNHLNLSFYDAITQTKQYKMNELAEHLSITVENAHGRTSKRIISEIIRNSGVNTRSFNVWHPSLHSLDDMRIDMPFVSGVSPTMIPDVIISRRHNTKDILLFCEEDSSQGGSTWLHQCVKRVIMPNI